MPDLPQWAHFMTGPERLRAFEDGVRRALAAREVEFQVDLPGGLASLRAPDGRRVELGLGSLARHWHGLEGAAEGGEGDAMIDAHFSALWTRAMHPDPALEARLDQLEFAGPLLRVWLITERRAVTEAEGLVQRRLAKGLHAILVLDLPTSVRPVDPARLSAWGRGSGPGASLPELWARAQAQTLAALTGEERPTAQRLRLFGQLACLALTGDSLFVTSALLGLDAVIDSSSTALPELGALVVAPTHHTLLVHTLDAPLNEATMATLLSGFQKAAASLYEQGPASLSPELYWWRGGALEHVRAGRDGFGRLVLGASEAFLEEVVSG